jgi:hypothetical protein
MYDSLFNRVELPETKIEKDLGIMISNDLKWSNQVNYIFGKANKMLGMIKHSFKNLDKNAAKLLYTSLVRPYLDYANSVWYPYLEQDKKKIEKIQRKATRTKCLNGKNYETRLTHFQLTSLEKRRERNDLIQLYKIVKKIDNITLEYPPDLIVSNTRGHSMRFHKQFIKNPKRYYFLTNRVINSWNKLDQNIVDSKTLKEFKSKLDLFLK